MKNPITDIRAAIIQDSRGTDTITVTVVAGGKSGSFSVPGGASTGSREVYVQEPKAALHIVEEIIKPALMGCDVVNQKLIDTQLHSIDATPLFSNIGGNVALGVSVAAAKTAALTIGIPTWKYIATLFDSKRQAVAPRLFINLINGGKHAVFGSVIQEHQIIVDTDTVPEAYDLACRVQVALASILEKVYGSEAVTKGDEGGFVIPSQSVLEPFAYLQQAITEINSPVPIFIGADIAASSFYSEAGYSLEGSILGAESLLDFYTMLHAKVPTLKFVEDPFNETDFTSFNTYARQHEEVLVIGDDLTTTNVTVLNQAIEQQSISGIIIKPNQIGTVSDTLNTMKVAYAHGINCIVSHRSGETEDDFIADLAVGTGSYGLKAGAPKTKEREIKYQRLISIMQSYHD